VGSPLEARGRAEDSVSSAMWGLELLNFKVRHSAENSTHGADSSRASQAQGAATERRPVRQKHALSAPESRSPSEPVTHAAINSKRGGRRVMLRDASKA